MKNNIKKWLLFTALFLALGHTVAPHSHHSESALNSEIEREMHSESEGLLDLFSKLFHTDLGIDHLDNYSVPTILGIMFVVIVALFSSHIFSVLQRINNASKSNYGREYVVIPVKQNYSVNHPFRGPPSH